MFKNYTSRVVVYTIFILVFILVLINYFLSVLFESVNYLYLNYIGIRFIIFVIGFITIYKHRLKFLNIGIILIMIGFVLEFINYFISYNRIFQDSIVLYLVFIINVLGFGSILLGAFKIINKNSSLNDELISLAYYDPLTNLPNRNYLKSVCKYSDNVSCDSCKTCYFVKKFIKGDKAAILFIDIDDFKLVNDYTGHAGGDKLLMVIAERLRSAVSDMDLVFRISGDEFLMIINNGKLLNDIDALLNKILTCVNETISIKEKDINITVSIGVAFYPNHGNNLESLLIKSDIAMYQAKRLSKNTYFIFDDSLEHDFDKKFESVYEIKRAIKNNEFVIHYQPKANINTNEIVGLEALIRWNHPENGLIHPNYFIPFVEEIGLIDKIDYIVLTLAARQISKWQEEGKKPYNISVNVSPHFFLNKNFISSLDKVIAKYKIDQSYISIEITENIALRDIEVTKNIIKQLKLRGIKVYIDDFGKGYSSIIYLKQFYFDYIKIDKTFIDNITNNKVDQALIEMILKISELLGFTVLAEGVEKGEQLEFLKEKGCHEYQGFLLGKPQPLEKLNL